MLQTPVLLIAFNRPDYVRQVLIEIRKQQPTQLYVCQDGVREGNILDAKRVHEVRSVINELVDWHVSCIHTTKTRTSVVVQDLLQVYHGSLSM